MAAIVCVCDNFEACAWRGQLALSAHILYHKFAPRALHARFFKYRTLEVHAVCLAGATGAHAGYLHCAYLRCDFAINFWYI